MQRNKKRAMWHKITNLILIKHIHCSIRSSIPNAKFQKKVRCLKNNNRQSKSKSRTRAYTVDTLPLLVGDDDRDLFTTDQPGGSLPRNEVGSTICSWASRRWLAGNWTPRGTSSAEAEDEDLVCIASFPGYNPKTRLRFSGFQGTQMNVCSTLLTHWTRKKHHPILAPLGNIKFATLHSIMIIKILILWLDSLNIKVGEISSKLNGIIFYIVRKWNNDAEGWIIRLVFEARLKFWPQWDF